MITKIKKLIKNFREWISPWYPIQIANPEGKYSDLCFKKDYGKRFVDRRKRLLNRLLPLIVSYGNREFIRRYGKPCHYWGIVTEFWNRSFIDLYGDSNEHLSLEFNFKYLKEVLNTKG